MNSLRRGTVVFPGAYTPAFTLIVGLLLSGTGPGLIAPARAADAPTVEALAKKSGCLKCHRTDKPAPGPAFEAIAARHRLDTGTFQLSLRSVSVASELPEKEKSKAIVARVGDGVHIRMFDGNGRKIVDKPESKLAKGTALTDLKRKLSGDEIPDVAAMPAEERQKILADASAAARESRAGARASVVETIKRGTKKEGTTGLPSVSMPPFAGRLSDREINMLAEWVLRPANAKDLKVMAVGLGSGTVTSTSAGINCGADCDEAYGGAETVNLTAVPDPGSTFLRWEGDASGDAATCTVTMDNHRSLRAVFGLVADIPPLTEAGLAPDQLRGYLEANPAVNSAARFVHALPPKFKQNWILMTRSESLQTGTAASPRILLPSEDAKYVFSVGLSTHNSYPLSHPDAVEYMQWDPYQKNFRFHEIVLADIEPMGDPITNPDGTQQLRHPKRLRGISIDEVRCSKCHSTQNVFNNTRFPGTTGLIPGTFKAKNKPNWDTYDSWGGMMPFNRDRIYQGSVEAAAFRKIFNLWTWRTNAPARSIIEQLELQPVEEVGSNGEPSKIPDEHVIRRTSGGEHDGHVIFGFDGSDEVFEEPGPATLPGSFEGFVDTAYAFDAQPGTGTPSRVVRDGEFVTLHHSLNKTSDEGRGVHLFDLLGGLKGQINAVRIADEVRDYSIASSASGGIDLRPILLAVLSDNCLTINEVDDIVQSQPGLTSLTDFSAFFNARHGMGIKALVADTKARMEAFPRRKADIQKLNLHRAGDPYLSLDSGSEYGLLQQYGGTTSEGVEALGDPNLLMKWLRQQVFRRPARGESNAPNEFGVMTGTFEDGTTGGIYVDRENYETGLNGDYNVRKIALFRYFLEPLGVSVDKWSLNVRGRSRAYTFADVLFRNLSGMKAELESGTAPVSDDQLIVSMNEQLLKLPAPDAIPSFIEVQRIFNKSCIECHGGLNYPPYSRHASILDLSEDEHPTDETLPSPRLARSYQMAALRTTPDPVTSRIYQRIINRSEACSNGQRGMMPCGGPALSQVDTQTIRRWILGGSASSQGAFHITTLNGVEYDFQGAGEFVLLRGENFEVQARQTPVETEALSSPNAHTGLASRVSVTTAVAVRVGRHRITYQPDPQAGAAVEGLQLRVDGELVRLNEQGISLATGGRIMPTIAPGGIKIELQGGSFIVITPGSWKYYQLPFLHVDAEHVRATQGLVGAVPQGSWLPTLRNGKSLGAMPGDLRERYQQLYEEFGNDWRVTNATTLFDYAPGTSTRSFTIVDWPGQTPNAVRLPKVAGQKPPVQPLALDAARQHANDLMDLRLRAFAAGDIQVTAEPAFATTYTLASKIKRNAAPTPPVLVYPEENKADLVNPVTFVWRASNDADGDPIRYRFYLWREDKTPNNNDAELLPIMDAETIAKTVPGLQPGQTYFWKVIAEDGKGAVVESETRTITTK